MSTFPSVVATLTNPNPTDHLNSPSHSGIHTAENGEITQIENFIGTDALTPGTLQYDIRSPSSKGGGHVQGAAFGGTGQTNFAKGDVLVATSASVLSKLAVGADSLALIADSSQAAGVAWGAVAKLDYQEFNVSGIWTKPIGINSNALVVIQLWGGGGSGGTSAAANAGSAGGGGGFNQGFFKASVLGATEQVNIGSGGASVLAANSDGNSGGITVFGASSILTAYGGGAGSGSNSGQGNGGGGGGGIASQGVNGANGSGGSGGVPRPFFGIVSSIAGLGGGTSRGGVDNIYGGGGGAGPFTQSGGGSFYGGGGGGGGGNNGAGGVGGTTTYGGGGGGGGGTTGGAAGSSFYGGNGGNGGSSVASGIAGTAPGGGGGGAINGQSTGAGAIGKARIWIV